MKNGWFAIGREVALVISTNSSILRPSKLDIQLAAKKLGISISDARCALDFFNYGDPTSPPAKRLPKLISNPE